MKSLNSRQSLAALGLSLLFASACTTGGGTTPAPTWSDHPATPASTLTPARTLTPTPVATEPQPAFPRTVIDDEGTSVEIASEPRRIVSLTPAATEIVFELGAGEHMVGGTDSDNYPPEAAALPDVVQGVTVLTEQVVDLEPDLVLAGGNNFTPPAEVQRLRDLGIAVLVVYPETVDQVTDDITLVGTAIGRDQSAADIVGAMSARIDGVVDAVEGLAQPRTFYEIGYGPDIYGPAPDSFIEDMVNLAGGDAIVTDDPAVFSIPLEQLVSRDPEVIVLGDAAYGTCPDGVATRPGWSRMSAVVKRRVWPVDDTIVTRPGPRLGEGLAALALAIHPDAAIDPPATGGQYCTE